MYKILKDITSPKDLKAFNYSELLELKNELKNYIIDVVSKNGGHLASNLGVIELTIALHRVFDSPIDKIIWDVGHQCYAHKILTGRKEDFKSIRTLDGISGFPKRSESEHDIFNTGHSSTSLSAALGVAKSRDLKGEDNSVIAVIGDGSLGGGIALEALNNAAMLDTSLIVVLNDNEMSISRNVGSLSSYLGSLRTGQVYFKIKKELECILNKIPIVGKHLFNVAYKFRDWFKYLIVRGIVFEELGFKYLGPIDGHNIIAMEKVFKNAKQYKKHPVLIHVVTRKGNGYPLAEKRPEKFHGVGPFIIKNGENLKENNERSYSKVFGDKMLELAREDERILAITAAMRDGTGLYKFSETFKDRFFDVGIAEQHAVTFCAGLAVGGYKPVFAVYSTFLQRAYDQLLHDVCLQNLPVVFAVDRAGIVGRDGETHQGIYDISYLRNLPNMTIMSPKSGKELEDMLELSISLDRPVAIRYPRGNEEKIADKEELSFGKAEVLREGEDAVILAEGSMVKTAILVSRILEAKGINSTVVNIRFIKPLDSELLNRLYTLDAPIYTIEDNIVEGGLGSAILEYFHGKNLKTNIEIFAHEKGIILQGDKSELLKQSGLDTESIAKKIITDIKGNIYVEE